ncbi:tight adherence pilus pseudopilin TadF [Vibrio sp. SCSIO 43136]|uniref:tight adherence pilus pseudopilin TadF n=1 Tax=Vibrio sp. SCSIO 43136 TaxID=2819101 RepID=UPI0020755525|nr:tight adherence pilus pseudopilin TadF [Vibrio sp. SCSIO 43136]USD66971.1 hypothetical protein J4N39_20240 [Vibrio sp. SCSIO 43136]
MQKVKGVIAIEMAFILAALALCAGFATDLSHKTSLQGDLDNLSYSAVNLLSERELLFNHKIDTVTDRPLTYRDAHKIHQVVESQIKLSRDNFDPRHYAIRVEGITMTSSQNPKHLRRHAQFVFGNRSLIGKKESVADLVKLAPYTNKQRHAPMYRVTVFYRSQGLFERIVGKKAQGSVIASSSFSVGR